MNASSPEIQWFIARDGKQYGPVSDVEMRKLVELGHMRPGDLVWRPGFAEWRPSAAVFPAPAPARPQPPPLSAPPAGPSPGGPQGASPAPSGSTAGGPARTPAAQQQSGYSQHGQPVGSSPGAPGPGAPASGPSAVPSGGGGLGHMGSMGGMGAGPMGAGSLGTGSSSSGSRTVDPGMGQQGTAGGQMSPSQGHMSSAQGHTSSAQGHMSGVAPQASSSWPNMGPATGRPGPGIPVSTIPTARPAGPGPSAYPGPGISGPGPGGGAGGFGSIGGHGSAGSANPSMGNPGMANAGMGGSAMSGGGMPQGSLGRGPSPQPGPAFQPIPTSTGATQPALGTTARSGGTQPGALQPISPTSDFEDESPAPSRRRSGGRLFAIAVVVLSLAAVGGFVMSKGGVEPALKSLGAMAGGGGQLSAPAAPTAAAMAPQDAGPKVSDAEITAGAEALDAKMQKAAMWAMVKTEYPDWYAARMKEGGKMVAEKKPDQAVTKYLVEQLVSLRRLNADQALGASTPRLKAVAAAFLANLRSLAARSTDACYAFISQGETSPPVIELMSNPGQNPPIEAQVITIFEAIAEGKKSRTAHSAPVKSDYDVLADQLAKIGWSQNDLQLFADPKALARSEPAKVCKMVQDWFAAHIAIPDAAVQERLLVETLRPVVAG